MSLFGIYTKSGKFFRTAFEGTRKQARDWANDHYIKGSFRIKELKPKKKKVDIGTILYRHELKRKRRKR